MPSKMAIGQSIRQGDILITRISAEEWDKISGDATLAPSKARKGKLVLAEGEATGHNHTVEGSGVSLSERPQDKGEKKYISVKARTKASVIHDEHGSMELPPGHFIMERQREHVPRSTPRRVYD